MSGRVSEDGYPGQSDDYAQCVIAKPPEGVLRPGGLRLTKQVIDTCAFARGAKVLDIGCGTGITVEYLCNIYDLCAVGIDISEERLQQGRTYNAGLRLIQAAGEALPFASNSIDGVLAECSLSVMQDTSRVLAEIERVLVPGGKLAVTDMYVRMGSVLQASCAYKGQKSGIRSYSELTSLLKGQGFRILAWEDQTAFLKEFVAMYIMEHGSAEALWQCMANRQQDKQLSSQALKSGLGYFSLIAEKFPAR